MQHSCIYGAPLRQLQVPRWQDQRVQVFADAGLRPVSGHRHYVSGHDFSVIQKSPKCLLVYTVTNPASWPRYPDSPSVGFQTGMTEPYNRTPSLAQILAVAAFIS
jgi:hypothetical protein